MCAGLAAALIYQERVHHSLEDDKIVLLSASRKAVWIQSIYHSSRGLWLSLCCETVAVLWHTLTIAVRCKLLHQRPGQFPVDEAYLVDSHSSAVHGHETDIAGDEISLSVKHPIPHHWPPLRTMAPQILAVA